MTTDNRTNELTPEQILVDEWIRQADRAKSMTGMDAIWFPDAEETLAVLRANGLLSEGTPSEAQARAIRKLDNVQAILAGAQASITDAVRELSLTSAAIVAAGVAPQAESADHEKLIARLTGSVNALSVTCGECGSKPGNRCYGGGEMRRWHASREAKAERALRIEAADALAALGLPSSGVDEDALAEVIDAALGKWDGLEPSVVFVARAVAEWLKDEAQS